MPTVYQSAFRIRNPKLLVSLELRVLAVSLPLAAMAHVQRNACRFGNRSFCRKMGDLYRDAMVALVS